MTSMKNLSFVKPTFFLLFFFIFFFLLFLDFAIASTSNAPYIPSDLILLNCGYSESTASDDGRKWTGDLNSKFGPKEPSDSKSVSAESLVQGSSVSQVPYMTARLSHSPFTYTFPVTAGQKLIRFYFYPSQYSGFKRSNDFFNVKVGPYTLLRNFSASFYADYGWQVPTFFKEYSINVEENQQLNITFSPFLSDSFAFINGIEIVSMPTNLYYKPPAAGLGLTFVGQKEKLYVKNDSALETICRLNVGGSNISPTEDTGMYRLWNDDNLYFYRKGVIPNELNFTPNYSQIPNYTAPDDVYRSSRSLGPNKTWNLLNNLTWQVPVDQGFKYLVRLHFCEIIDVFTEVNDRRFSIFIHYQIAQLGFDVFESSGGRRIPIYNDYIVEAGSKGKTNDYDLYISLHPDKSSNYGDVILNGMEVFKLNDSKGNLAGPNPFPPAGAPEPATSATGGQPILLPINKSNSSKKTSLIAVGASVISLVMILSLFCCVIIWRYRKRKSYGSYYESLSCCWVSKHSKRHSSIRIKASSLPEELCRHFSLVQIKAATNNFHESLIIGVGGFGNVYEGSIDEGEKVVAIKRLNPESRQGPQEFNTEIEMLSRLRHVHLVSLIGYCHEEGEMILVYDHMSNGTLKQHLYETNNDALPWKKRLEICLGASRGLHYLHFGAAHTVIHRDIKTTNILLDKNWVAKVSDFGLSKIGVNNSAVSTLVKGTFGYLDPEYARRQQLTEKSDVYSFGVVLFEVLCARKALNRKLEDEEVNLANWVRKCIQNGTVHQIIDPFLMGKISPDCFNKFVEIAESCIRDNGNDRPSMHDVMENLEFALQLQEAADAAQKETDKGSEYVYPEVSFKAPRYTKVIGGYDQLNSIDLASGSSSTFEEDTNITGLSFPTLESGTITSSHGFSNNFTPSSATK